MVGKIERGGSPLENPARVLFKQPVLFPFGQVYGMPCSVLQSQKLLIPGGRFLEKLKAAVEGGDLCICMCVCVYVGACGVISVAASLPCRFPRGQ